MIKWSNVCLYTLKFVKQKDGANGNLLIVKFLDVFDSGMYLIIFEILLYMAIGMTFVKSSSSVMFCRFMCLFMNSLKLTKTFIRECIVYLFCIHLAYVMICF